MVKREGNSEANNAISTRDKESNILFLFLIYFIKLINSKPMTIIFSASKIPFLPVHLPPPTITNVNIPVPLY